MVYESELYHHGILGQKWGKKNGPPYPLGSSDHSAAEKKAGSKNGYKGWADPNNWAPVKNKKEYGLSKGQVKSKVKKAQRNYNKENVTLFSKTTGDSWAKVKSQHQDEWFNDKTTKKLNQQARELNQKMNEAYDNGNTSLGDKYAKQAKQLGDQYVNHMYDVAKKYKNDYQEALLKDIGYDNVDLGKKMLDEYKIYNYEGMGLEFIYNGEKSEGARKALKRMGYKV